MPFGLGIISLKQAITVPDVMECFGLSRYPISSLFVCFCSVSLMENGMDADMIPALNRHHRLHCHRDLSRFRHIYYCQHHHHCQFLAISFWIYTCLISFHFFFPCSSNMCLLSHLPITFLTGDTNDCSLFPLLVFPVNMSSS